ncbi:MAG: TetR/AcrR family transcriptional regulator [Rhizobacter sp.]
MTRTAPDRINEILDHALALFAERGLAAASTRDLADRAGLARSHVYHYFKDWQALRCAAFARFAHRELEHARIELARLPGREALEAFAAGWLDGTADPSAALWIDAWVEALRDPVLAAAYNDAMQQWIALLENVLHRAGVPHDTTLARQMFALINGYTLAAGLRISSTKPPELRELVGAIDRLIMGAAPSARPLARR